MTDDQIKHMVSRFLQWKLPESFNPDGGISFQRDFNTHTPFPSKHEPVGTNLLDGVQAEAMVRHMIEGLPASPSPAASPASPSGVRVKPLEYVKPHGSETLTRAETILGEAVVWTHHEANGRWFWKLGKDASGTEASEADCKRMLWATYEHRLLSALASDATPAAVFHDKPFGWGSTQEWEMEQAAFHANGRSDIPPDVRALVATLWRQYALAAAPKAGKAND